MLLLKPLSKFFLENARGTASWSLLQIYHYLPLQNQLPHGVAICRRHRRHRPSTPWFRKRFGSKSPQWPELTFLTGSSFAGVSLDLWVAQEYVRIRNDYDAHNCALRPSWRGWINSSSCNAYTTRKASWLWWVRTSDKINTMILTKTFHYHDSELSFDDNAQAGTYFGTRSVLQAYSCWLSLSNPRSSLFVANQSDRRRIQNRNCFEISQNRIKSNARVNFQKSAGTSTVQHAVPSTVQPSSFFLWSKISIWTSTVRIRNLVNMDIQTDKRIQRNGWSVKDRLLEKTTIGECNNIYINLLSGRFNPIFGAAATLSVLPAPKTWT